MRAVLGSGLSATTRKSYASGQKKFIQFCTQTGRLHLTGSPCRTDEWTFCLFVSNLAGSIQHSSIKVYLSAVRSLYIKQGFPDPLIDCVRPQLVVRGIKRSQGSANSQQLPMTDDILLVIFKSLDLLIPDHGMVWAA